MLCVLDFFGAGTVAGVQDFVGHVGVARAGGQAVDLHVEAPDFFVERLGHSHEAGFSSRVRAETRPRIRGAATAYDNDLAAAALDHLRQHGAAGVHHADKIDLHSFGPLFGFDFDERSYRTLHGGGSDENLNAAEDGPHPVSRGAHLLEITYVGADTQGC